MRLRPSFWWTKHLARILLVSTTLAACQESDQGPRPPSDSPSDVDDDSDQPIRLSYVCGNRFILVNSYSVPITVSWRVAETSEEGSATVAASDPARHPSASEQPIETSSQGTVELYLEGRKLKTRANGAIPCTPTVPAPSFAGAAPASQGAWSSVHPWPLVAVHLNLLPNGKVLAWGSSSGDPRVWNPATNAFTSYPSPALLFCAGHSFTPDGQLLVIGGHIRGDHGLPNVTLFNQSTGWSSLPPMPRGRWYPTATTMSNGAVVALAGLDQLAKHVTVPEVWTSGTGLRSLTGASLQLPYYPVSFLAPNGKLFVAGEGQMSRYLNIGGNGSWSTVGLRRFGTRDQGSAVMYDYGKILYAGGGRTTNTAEVIDLTRATPTWRWTGSMAYARRHHTLTLLPTGEVLVTGGTAGTVHNDLTRIVRAAEIWSPATGLWTTMASGQVERAYHSTSLLLPDGRVLHAGSGSASPAPNQFSAQFFSPPYLFRGSRPVITSAPSTVWYSSTFRVVTPNAASIRKVSLIRLGSVTHGVDMNQRFRWLPYTADATGLTLGAMTDRSRTPPGHYMLFILNENGVPSVAKIIRLR
jgi:galactose oxidase